MARDFRKKTFQRVLRGYAPEEVDEYIAYIQEEYRKLERRSNDAERKLILALKKLEDQQSAQEQLSQEKMDEAYMQAVHEAEALLAEAETSAANIREAAVSEAEKQLAEAEATAKLVLETAQKDASHAKHEAAGLYDAASEMYEEVISFRDTIFSLYNTHIEAIESISESAKSYVDRVDGHYSEAAGVEVSHNDEELLEYEETVTEASESETEPEDSAPVDVQEEVPVHRDIYIDPFEDDEVEGEEEDGNALQIDWKNRRVIDQEEAETNEEETRVLDLRSVREAEDEYADFNDEQFDGNDSDVYDTDDVPFYDDADDEMEEQSEDFEKPRDFDEIGRAFGDMDSLFTEDRSGQELSLTDEFDIVFSGADSKRNVEEIRRQPTIPADEPKKAKKHKKY